MASDLDLIELIHEWYRSFPGHGGPLHCQLDDLNLDDGFMHPPTIEDWTFWRSQPRVSGGTEMFVSDADYQRLANLALSIIDGLSSIPEDDREVLVSTALDGEGHYGFPRTGVIASGE